MEAPRSAAGPDAVRPDAAGSAPVDLRREVVAVTGAAHPLAAALARRLAGGEPSAPSRRPAPVVLALDERSPAEDLGAARRVRVDARGASLARVLDAEGVGVVVDCSLLPGGSSRTGGQARDGQPPPGLHVLSAVQRVPSVRRVVLASSTGVYGASPRAPSVRTEASELATPSGGLERAAAEVEAALRATTRRREDVAAVVLRLAEVVGPGLRTPLGEWLELPAVPCLWGHDPRLQVLHAEDAVEALLLAVRGDVSGVVNVAGDGVVTLSQAAALCGRTVLPVPAALLGRTASALVGRAVPLPWGDADRVLRSGRVVDLRRMHEDLGLSPRWSSRAAVEDLARGRGLAGPLSPEVRRAAADRAAGAWARLRAVAAAAGHERDGAAR
ncbi:NAD-dependent epimerase/dehydratase family protein [uncultured Pseudokineococcus sp.]|uniref:NAD-dependent epimerase/dehydratase family protein n=1 Tax=uncultured Pseudokineococcus sp. TaxID=1642928 RepID=UPI00261D44D7|nr:NAD-dependent epimerase/dehydratase family protein [uncultured Pseudokineococcus sp.]